MTPGKGGSERACVQIRVYKNLASASEAFSGRGGAAH